MTLDPVYAKDLPHIWACNQLYNTLLAFDDDMNLVPSLAKRWYISDDGKTYTFVLRDDVFFITTVVLEGKAEMSSPMMWCFLLTEWSIES